MTWNARRILSFLAFSAIGSAGCQGGAGVKIAFDNKGAAGITQALSLSAGQTPTVFGIRMVVAYLVEDTDAQMNNLGEVGRIWTNPVCDPDLYHCGIGPSAGANRVTDYFDLALPSAEVNARLNAQEHTIKPGTYRVLRLDLAGPEVPGDFDVPNMRYGMVGDTASEVRRNNNYNVTLDPPLVLADGDTVTMSLGYDIRDSYYVGPGTNINHPAEGISQNDWYCGNLASGPCLAFKGFAPSVTRSAAGAP